MRPLRIQGPEERLRAGERRLDRLERRLTGTVVYEIKIVSDDFVAVSGVDHFKFAVPSDLDGLAVLTAHGFVTTVGTTATTIDVKKNGVSIMAPAITIDSNEKTSYTAAAPPVVAANTLATGDEIEVIVTTQGTGAMGHGAIVEIG